MADKQDMAPKNQTFRLGRPGTNGAVHFPSSTLVCGYERSQAFPSKRPLGAIVREIPLRYLFKAALIHATRPVKRENE